MYRSMNGQPQRNNVGPAMYRNRMNGRHERIYRPDQDAGLVQATVIEQFKESWLTAIIGLILFATGMCLFVWNESRAVKIAYSLDEALNNITVIQNDFKPIPEFDNQLVYLSGPLTVSEPLTEPDYNIMISCVKLKKKAQMYQWVEIEEDQSYPGSSEPIKHYYYTTKWKDKLIDHNDFYIKHGHENPTEMPIKSQIQIATDVRIGNFELSNELKNKFNDFVEITSDERPERPDIKMHSGLYYHSLNLWVPKIGDIRVLISYAGKSGDYYTVVGKVVNGVIEPFTTTHGHEILLLRKGEVYVDKMFHLEHVNNYWKTWAIRGLGWLVMFLAATCLANILKTIIMNSHLLCGIISTEYLTMSVSISLSLLVIGFAWVWYRPVIGLGLVLTSIIPFIYSTMGSDSAVLPPQQQRDYRRL